MRALGRAGDFEGSLRSLRPGGTLSSLGVYSGKVQIPYEASRRGWAITASSHPVPRRQGADAATDGGVRHGRVDLTPLLSIPFSLNESRGVWVFASGRGA